MPQAQPATTGPSIQLLGLPRWQFSPQPGAGSDEPLATRDAALLALLAVDGAAPRDRVAAWLWPDSAQQQANTSLRQRIFKLRRQCGHALIEVGPTLRLAPGLQVDLLQDPLPVDGVLLAGLDLSAFETFDQWLQSARLVLGRRQVDAGTGKAALFEARGAWASAITLCERLVAAHPQTEHVWRRLMRLHWLRSDRAAAIATFERFEMQVCREEGLRPSAETLSLLAQVEREEATQPAHAQSADPNNSSATDEPGLPESLMHPPVLVGRQAALQVIEQAWQAGRAVLLQAPGGMGKSRLLDALMAGRPGVLCLRARPGDASQPYGTLNHVLTEALDRFAPELSPAVRRELARVLPQLGAVSSLQAQQMRLWQSIEAAWLACMQQGLQALMLDDLHNADTATLELLRWQLASPRLATLRMIYATRPDEDTPATPLLQAWLGDSLRMQPLNLGPWSLDDVQQLLRSLDLPETLQNDQRLAVQLMRQTGGQPFFVLEALKAHLLTDHGAGGLEPWPSLEPMPAAAPAAVGAMIDRRLQRLTPGSRSLLQLLAVAGADLGLEVAAQALQRPLMDLSNSWSELATAQLVHADGLAHDLVSACVLQGLPAPARAALHLTWARAWAAAAGSQPGVAARLAPHWQAAQAWPEAGQAWLQAAQAAVGAGRLDDADGLFERASRAFGEASDAAAQVQVLTAALASRLVCQGPEHVVPALQQKLQNTAEPGLRARLLLLLTEADMARMQFAAAQTAAAQALALAQDLPTSRAERPALLNDATLLHARALAWNGRADEAVLQLQKACAEADGQDDLRQRLRTRTLLTDVLVPAGRRMESVQLQQEALSLAQTLGDQFETAVCAANLATYRILVADAPGAYAAARQALQGMAAMGMDHVERVMCAAVFAFAGAHLGRFDEVQDATAPLLAMAGHDGRAADQALDPVMRNLRNVLSTLALWRGQPDEAAALLPPDDESAPLSVRATGLLARLRWLSWINAPKQQRTPVLQQLQALGQQHPALREDAHFYRGWSLFEPAQQALPQLDRLAQAQRALGCEALARSLEVSALQLQLTQDPAAAGQRARDLQVSLAQGFHASIYPPEAWWAVAQALQHIGDADGAAQARAAARQWIDAAQLPPGKSRADFRRRNPINRRVLAR